MGPSTGAGRQSLFLVILIHGRGETGNVTLESRGQIFEETGIQDLVTGLVTKPQRPLTGLERNVDKGTNESFSTFTFIF